MVRIKIMKRALKAKRFKPQVILGAKFRYYLFKDSEKAVDVLIGVVYVRLYVNRLPPDTDQYIILRQGGGQVF